MQTLMLARLQQFTYSRMARAQSDAIRQRMMNRVAQVAATHAGGAMIEQSVG